MTEAGPRSRTLLSKPQSGPLSGPGGRLPRLLSGPGGGAAGGCAEAQGSASCFGGRGAQSRESPGQLLGGLKPVWMPPEDKRAPRP